MTRIVYFRAGSGHNRNVKVVTRAPVLRVDEMAIEERIGPYPNQLRLNIHAWDLQVIIAEANRLGREGHEVTGFGYDYDTNEVVMGPNR